MVVVMIMPCNAPLGPSHSINEVNAIPAVRLNKRLGTELWWIDQYKLRIMHFAERFHIFENLAQIIGENPIGVSRAGWSSVKAGKVRAT